MELEKIILERQSVRKYKDEQISNEQLQKILNAGNMAPTAKNTQPQKIYVCQSKESLEKIDKATPCRFGAPTVLLICGDKNIAFHNDTYSSYEMDCSIVTTHMMLEAYNVGVGSLWVLRFDKEIAKQEFELDENVYPVCLMMLGYEAEGYAGNPNHTVKKPLESIVTYK